ncbi:hypothetical protein [Natronococcus wangiae]|uniref:hypothetical protein n=1 Tax=Natronococcus wangiae TaxID=3068275 RepID=UPI00273D5BB2|nr:hypothetical protein [Natronococcus sp. AD5]
MRRNAIAPSGSTIANSAPSSTVNSASPTDSSKPPPTIALIALAFSHPDPAIGLLRCLSSWWVY